MNIKKMLETQKRLDQANFDKAGITEYPLEEVKIAYRVELGEALQEAKFWKYWKKSKGEVDREKLLEELADCLHFAFSLSTHINGINCHEDMDSDCFEVCENIEEANRIANKCFKLHLHGKYVIYDTIDLAIKMGFTLEELEKAYYRKNKINWDRVNSNY